MALRWLAYAHPVWMILSLAVVVLALRAGLRLRQQRQGRPAIVARPRGELLAAHLRLAKPAVVLVLVGFVAGPISAVWLRGFEPFSKFHGWLGLLAAALFALAAFWGHALETGRSREASRHGMTAGLALLVAALGAVAGFVLLP